MCSQLQCYISRLTSMHCLKVKTLEILLMYSLKKTYDGNVLCVTKTLEGKSWLFVFTITKKH